MYVRIHRTTVLSIVVLSCLCVPLYFFLSPLPVLEQDNDDVATTGRVFGGAVVRASIKARFRDGAPPSSKPRPTEDSCDKWAVVTTIFEPTEAVRRVSRMAGWCLVIIADRKSPRSYPLGWVPNGSHWAKRVVYLSPEDQEAMTAGSAFISGLPWNHFARKNVGYLYAIIHGAKYIWDFDDDNLLKFWVTGTPTGFPALEHVLPAAASIDVRLIDTELSVVNPYPVLGGSGAWPRGFPLEDILIEGTRNFKLGIPKKVPNETIGVIQSLADRQPDVDAIYRLTRPTPWSFATPTSSDGLPIVIPRGTFVPYNAQATLHARTAFWAILLPITVHGRVSDIWRSFLAQRLFWDLGIHLAFPPRPLVVQDRNVHSNLADFDAEGPLYKQSGAFIAFLRSWTCPYATLPACMEDLWIETYTRGFIEAPDVLVVQQWIGAISEAGYQWPVFIDKWKPPPTAASPDHNDRVLDQAWLRNGDGNTCTLPGDPRTIWTSDLHDGTRLDPTTVLSEMGQTVMLAGEKGTTSPYPDNFARPGIKMVPASGLSPAIKTFNLRVPESAIRSNYEFYTGGSNPGLINKVDTFMCQFPSSMCLLWMPFNRTIVYMPAHRYTLGRCTPADWLELNDRITAMIRPNEGHPRGIVAAMSHYDAEYIWYYLGIRAVPLYSSCTGYTGKIKWDPSSDWNLFLGDDRSQLPGEDQVRKLRRVGSLYGHYTLQHLASHRAAVMVPYSVMSYKLSEIYSLSVPLFVPSLKFYAKMGKFHDRVISGTPYCDPGPFKDAPVLPHARNHHPYSPESTDLESLLYWLQLADWNEWPHIQFFDDAADLSARLKALEVDPAGARNLHDRMVKENQRRRAVLEREWCLVLNKIDRGRVMPTGPYEQTVKALWGLDSLSHQAPM